MDGAPPLLSQPYWGSRGGALRWGGASFPNRRQVMETFGADDEPDPLVHLVCDLVPADAPHDSALLATARRSLPDAIDLLWAAARPDAGDEGARLTELSVTAVAYARSNPEPPWLRRVEDDESFVKVLSEELATHASGDRDGSAARPEDDTKSEDGWEQFGGFRSAASGMLQQGAWRVRRAAVDRPASAVVDTVRGRTQRHVAEFLGDIVTYYRQRGEQPGQSGIGKVVGDALRAAHAQREAADPLVVVAHSMGGNIVYDLLSGPLGTTLSVDALVTVGSQVGLFQELDLFSPLPPDIPGSGGTRLPLPASVRRWINVYDVNDMLAFRASPVFDGAEDLEFRTGRLRSHSAYFQLPSFYARLSERLGGAL
ncbi:hypothetical protein ACWEN3_16865 [Streptomyces sp. NPDC004561]